MKDYEKITKEVLNFRDVVGASPFVYGQGMLVGENNVSGAVVRGIDPETAGHVTNIEEAIGRGVVGREERAKSEKLVSIGKEIILKLGKDTKSGRPPIIIGRELATTLGVSLGDVVNLVSPFGRVGPFGPQAKIKRFEIIGISDYGMVEYDSSIAYVDLMDAMEFFEMGDSVTGVEVKVTEEVFLNGRFGVGVGTIVMLVNAALLTGYTFGCHSWRHLIGGRFDCFTCDGKPTARYGIWKRSTWLNERHMAFAWLSLVWVAFTDFYIYLVSSGRIRDLNTW